MFYTIKDVPAPVEDHYDSKLFNFYVIYYLKAF